MTLLFLPLVQEHFQVFQFRPLKGVFNPAPEPEFSMKSYAQGQWQEQTEDYLGEHFGFREPVIRLYNQYVYDFYNKTYSSEISVGRDRWLYQKDGVTQYYGLMGQRHKLSNEAFEENLAIETRSLVKIRAILQEYGIELMTFTLPVKSYVYPEHLRPQPFVDTLFHADEYYDRQLRAAGFPHINMTPWFQDIRDDYPFTLFYEKGSHWASGAVLGTDSLLRFMETLKGEHFARIVQGTPYEVPVDQMDPKDYDLAALLNTIRLPKQRMPLYEIPVTIEQDSNTVYPNVLFVGSSYYWYMTARIPFEKIFDNRDFMYYNYTYFSKDEVKFKKMENVNTLKELLLHDYVVYFKNAPQLYLDGFSFFGKSLIALCISDKRFSEKIDEVADSLMRYQPDPSMDSSQYRYQAQLKLIKNPELFEELRGDGIPTARNPMIQHYLMEKALRNDRSLAFLVTCKANNDSIDLDKAFALEAQQRLMGRSLVSKPLYHTTYDYFNFLTEETMHDLHRTVGIDADRNELFHLAWDRIDSLIDCHAYDHDSLMLAAYAMSQIVQNLEYPKALDAIRGKAEQRQISVDQMFRNDVVWSYNTMKTRPAIDSAVLKQYFERYKTEFGLRLSKPTMEKVATKAKAENNPQRSILDREITWVLNNKK